MIPPDVQDAQHRKQQDGDKETTEHEVKNTCDTPAGIRSQIGRGNIFSPAFRSGKAETKT